MGHGYGWRYGRYIGKCIRGEETSDNGDRDILGADGSGRDTGDVGTTAGRLEFVPDMVISADDLDSSEVASDISGDT